MGRENVGLKSDDLQVQYLGRMTEPVPIPDNAVEHARTPASELRQFESSVRGMLDQFGLPTEQLFVPVTERAKMVNNVGEVLLELDPQTRNQSHYVSKMVAAATVGLFDAALNYLWDELVSALRTRIAGFDLAYFFDIAAGSNADLRKGLKTEADLSSVDDARTLRASLEIGLISDIGFKRLDHVRYMRNHASAAHPNQNELSGLELVTFLELCIREVINTSPDTVTANTGRLLSNIKKDRLDQAAVESAAAFFDQLPPDRADTLANGLFGLYVAQDRSPIIADNVRMLWPRLWPFVGESARNNYGLRQARAGASADTGLASAARELIELANGQAYLAQEVRAVDMHAALEQLAAAHNGFNNFYNEPEPARRVFDLAGEHGDVPAPVRERYIGTVVECYLGNGFGISAGAEVLYEKMLERMSTDDASIALRMFMNPALTPVLSSAVGARQWAKLLDMLEPKLTKTTDRNLMAGIRAFTGKPDQLRADSNLKRLADAKA